MLPGVFDELAERRDIDRKTLSKIVSEGVLAAYQKKFPDLAIKVDCDAQTGKLDVEAEKTIVGSVRNELTEISLKKARALSPGASVGETLWAPFLEPIGRIEIVRARQVIASMIREVEAQAVYNEFKEREGEIVHGVIHKCGRSGMVVKIDEALAFLPQSLMVPTDKCVVGFAIRARLKEVLPEPQNDNQLILDRASEDFLQKLFELEIPEVFERLVEIKKVVRIAGYKSKVAVISNEKNIDPVGTCVGVRGGRIKPILKELGGEKIDVIVWKDSLEELVRDALKPAVVNRVDLSDGGATVWVEEDQRSLAIGRLGQNVALASRMTGLDIQLAPGAKRGPGQDGATTEEEVFEQE